MSRNASMFALIQSTRSNARVVTAERGREMPTYDSHDRNDLVSTSSVYSASSRSPFHRCEAGGPVHVYGNRARLFPIDKWGGWSGDQIA